MLTRSGRFQQDFNHFLIFVVEYYKVSCSVWTSAKLNFKMPGMQFFLVKNVFSWHSTAPCGAFVGTVIFVVLQLLLLNCVLITRSCQLVWTVWVWFDSVYMWTWFLCMSHYLSSDYLIVTWTLLFGVWQRAVDAGNDYQTFTELATGVSSSHGHSSGPGLQGLVVSLRSELVNSHCRLLATLKLFR